MLMSNAVFYLAAALHSNDLVASVGAVLCCAVGHLKPCSPCFLGGRTLKRRKGA